MDKYKKRVLDVDATRKLESAVQPSGENSMSEAVFNSLLMNRGYSELKLQPC